MGILAVLLGGNDRHEWLCCAGLGEIFTVWSNSVKSTDVFSYPEHFDLKTSFLLRLCIYLVNGERF